MPALAEKSQITEYGNILIPGESGGTIWAMRGREDYRLAGVGKSQNDNVQKTADNRTEKTGQDEKEKLREHDKIS